MGRLPAVKLVRARRFDRLLRRLARAHVVEDVRMKVVVILERVDYSDDHWYTIFEAYATPNPRYIYQAKEENPAIFQGWLVGQIKDGKIINLRKT